MQATKRSADESAGAMTQTSWGSLTWVASRELTGSDLTLGRVVIRQGSQNPRHCHDRCEEVLYLLRGRLRHTVGDDAVDMCAGDSIAIPKGVMHNAINIGDEPAEMIVAFSSGERDFRLEAEA